MLSCNNSPATSTHRGQTKSTKLELVLVIFIADTLWEKPKSKTLLNQTKTEQQSCTRITGPHGGLTICHQRRRGGKVGSKRVRKGGTENRGREGEEREGEEREGGREGGRAAKWEGGRKREGGGRGTQVCCEWLAYQS